MHADYLEFAMSPTTCCNGIVASCLGDAAVFFVESLLAGRFLVITPQATSCAVSLSTHCKGYVFPYASFLLFHRSDHIHVCRTLAFRYEPDDMF